mgnify:CR=1 FL=1
MTIHLSGPASQLYINGHWDFPAQMGRGVGFVYAIVDKIQQKGYIGRKNYKVATGYRKGASSDWHNYCSSSASLERHMTGRNIKDFEFIALEEYATLATLGFAETWSQVMTGVAVNPNWLNTRIEEVRWACAEPITSRHIERLRAVSKRIPGGPEWVI